MKTPQGKAQKKEGESFFAFPFFEAQEENRLTTYKKIVMT